MTEWKIKIKPISANKCRPFDLTFAHLHPKLKLSHSSLSVLFFLHSVATVASSPAPLSSPLGRHDTILSFLILFPPFRPTVLTSHLEVTKSRCRCTDYPFPSIYQIHTILFPPSLLPSFSPSLLPFFLQSFLPRFIHILNHCKSSIFFLYFIILFSLSFSLSSSLPSFLVSDLADAHFVSCFSVNPY